MMKKTLLSLAFAFMVACFPALAQNFKPFTALRVIKTERFDIIFPEESRRSAETLASFADSTYERVSLLLGIEVGGRIPVVITPQTDVFNGYMNPFPSPHIVLFDTPMDIEWTTFRNSLEGLFLHELTHAVSLSSRGPFFDFLHGIFGGWVLPTGLTAPLFMAEGVTVSFESLDGFGRANDPEVKQRLRQAIHEGDFLTPFQASGVYDKPPFGNAYYEYGGLFSAYLQKRFGMEKYAELWRAMGSRFPVSLSFDRHGFSRIFQDVYGIPLKEAWSDLASSIAVDGLEENEGGALTSGESMIRSMASGGGRVFVLDRVVLAVDSFDPVSGERTRVIATDGPASDIEVSADGRRLIVSDYRYADALATAVATEYETSGGRRTGRRWNGLYKPRYFRDGVVALASDLHDNRIVYRDAAGAERVLLQGNDERLFSAPAPINDDRIAFIVADRGVRRIGIYDFRTGVASLLSSGLADDGERWRYARDLRSSDGRIFFSYDHDDRFYKLAMIDFKAGAEPTAFFATRDFSGGVFSPVLVGDTIVYRGAFSTWDALMRYPEKLDGLTGTKAKLSLEPWPETDREARPMVGSSGAAFPERSYVGLGYLNPLKLWLPAPLLRMDSETFRIDGGGIISYLSTPTDMNTALLSAGGDVAAGMGYFDLTWNSHSLGVPLTVKASDKIEFVENRGFEMPYRATRTSAQFTFSRGIGGGRTKVFLVPSAQAVWAAPEDTESSSAYGWTYVDGQYAVGAALGVSNLERLPWRLFGRGLSTTFQSRLALPSMERRYDGVIRVAAEPILPVRLTLYGAWDEGGQDLDGHTVHYGDAPFFYAAAKEYVNDTEGGHRWVAGGEVEFRVFSTEIQQNFSHLYFNRLFGILAWRGAAYEAESDAGPELPGTAIGDEALLVQSMVFKTGAVLSAIPAAMVPLRLSPYFWAAWKLSSIDDGDAGNNFAFGVALSVEW